MIRHFFLPVLVLFLAAPIALAETIVLNGVKIENVEVFESDTRYYVQYQDGRSESYPKSQDIVVGEDKIREMEAAAAAAEAAARAAEEAAAAEREARRQELAKIQRAGAAVAVSESGNEVNALVVAYGGVTVAFVSMDAAFVEEPLVSAVAARLADSGSEISRDTLLLAATGAHTGMLSGASRNRISEVLLNKYDEAAFNAAVTRVVDAVSRAEAGMEEATLKIAESDAPGFHAVRENTSPTPDSTLGILLAERKSDNSPIGIIINYALEPALLADPGLKAVENRGPAGVLCGAVRGMIGAELPVVFFNGAAGDLAPAPDTGVAELADVVTAALSGAQPVDQARIDVRAERKALPPTLMAGIMPTEALLQEVRIAGAAFISIPASLASQWGQLLRAKAAHADAGQLFILANCGDYTGYSPSLPEFFAASDYNRTAFYGPLTGLYYAQAYLPGGDEIDLATWIPMLNDQIELFRKGMERGAADAAAIEQTWTGTAEKMKALVAILERVELPGEAKGIIQNLSKDEIIIAGRQLLAIFVRSEFAPLNAAQMTQLSGVAQGAGLPFDAIYLLQVFSNPASITNQQVSGAIQLFQLTGLNFLD